MTITLALLSSLSFAHAAPARPNVVCETQTTAVDTTDGPILIEGDYCRPRHGRVHTVQVLTHGATYDRRYWQAPSGRVGFDPVARLVMPGFAVFNYDRLGSGASEHPPSPSVTVDRHAEVLHGLVTRLREGTIGCAHDRVISIGHSLGAIVAVTEAAMYQDVDGVVLTGFSHTPSEAAQAHFATLLLPAALDPAFAELDAGYFTTQPGTREGLFYPTGAPAAYVAYDEATKGIVALGELAGPTLGDLSGDVTCPVLLVAGAQDPFACDEVACTSSRALAARERTFFTDSPRVDALVLPRRGHALTGGPGVARWIDALHAWSTQP